MQEGYISRRELFNRWPDVDNGELLAIINNGYSTIMFPSMNGYFFRAYHPTYNHIIINELESIQESKGRITTSTDNQVPYVVDRLKDLFQYLDKCFYKMEQIENAEKFLQISNIHHSIHKKQNRKSQIDKEKVRNIAQKMWAKNNSLTIVDIINSDDVNAATEPECYNDKTLRNWIKDLAPNRKPGRRKK